MMISPRHCNRGFFVWRGKYRFAMLADEGASNHPR